MENTSAVAEGLAELTSVVAEELGGSMPTEQSKRTAEKFSPSVPLLRKN